MAIEQLGPYKINELLGRGGMGVVYAGVHEQTGQTAAIKMLSQIHSDDSNFRERFSTEIESLKKLRHDNIVKLFGYGEHDGHMFYAMELVPGSSLQQQLTSGVRYSWEEVADFAIQICRALKHAHDRGIIHRDLKPANLLLTPENVVKLSDFGIAKLFGASQLTADGGVVGTADYMAPEQSAGLATTTRTDMFSLGCVLYALLVGRPPFAAPTVAEALHRLRYEDPPLLSRRVMDVPAELEEIIMQLLEKEPSARIATPMALSNRLRAMLHGLSGSGDPTIKGSSGEVVVSAEMPTAKVDPRKPQPETAARSTVAVPEDQDALLVQMEGPDQQPYHTLDFETSPSVVAPRENRFITAEEARQAEADENAESPSIFWLRLAAIVVLLAAIVGGFWLFARPASEKQLYDRIKEVAEQEDPQSLADLEDELSTFLSRFPDSEHRPEVVQYQEEVELYRMSRRFERRLRRPGREESLSIVERQYLDALRLSNSDPDEAALRFTALIELFDDPDDADSATRQCVRLAKLQIERLQDLRRDRRKQARTVLQERLDRAAQIRQSDRQHAIRICRGLIALYQDQVWAADLVAQARRLLSEM